MLHYTNRGLGMISPHVRFDCRPEITVFTFIS
jgi:predicted MPP superfamily phosphohydrolase